MGLTERHLFEDEEPELTENQLEDILWENNKIFERGYQKGYFDGKSSILREQEPVVANWQDQTDPCDAYLLWRCSRCGHYSPTETRYAYCPYCGAKMEVKRDE